MKRIHGFSSKNSKKITDSGTMLLLVDFWGMVEI